MCFSVKNEDNFDLRIIVMCIHGNGLVQQPTLGVFDRYMTISTILKFGKKIGESPLQMLKCLQRMALTPQIKSVDISGFVQMLSSCRMLRWNIYNQYATLLALFIYTNNEICRNQWVFFFSFHPLAECRAEVFYNQCATLLNIRLSQQYLLF